MQAFTQREQRAIMLETQMPAYARSAEVRRAIDLKVRRARNLRRAFLDAGMNMPVHVRAVVPLQHRLVSGLNVPSNFDICVGRQEIKAFTRLQHRAKKALERRNA